MALASEQQLLQLQALIEDLQMRIAFQDDTIAELSDIIATQGNQLALLQQQQLVFSDKFKSIEHSMDNSQSTPSDERPPHY